MKWVHVAKTIFEVEGEDDMEEVTVYELHVGDVRFGYFNWPKGWPWTWGPNGNCFDYKHGYVFHCGPFSIGFYY